ncbi:Golgi-associated plant pathogenesis-related protein 1-like [Pocillopora damicornis]|nr:Golgi-associated plant pathogenesis-related protein 1-like [Pocillopora damicornis]CAH3041090.1 unnamed protein product [Pocillopora meandrina]
MKLLLISVLLSFISNIFTESPTDPEVAGNAPIVLPTGTFSQQEVNGLKEHNRFRAIHDAPPMTLDREMCNSAAQWAKYIAEQGSLEHSTEDQRPEQGENLSMGCSSDKAQTVKEAVANWYNELCNPGYYGLGELETGPDEAGHFSQVVWKESTKLGIGRAEIEQNGMKCAYIVGRYNPPGNVQESYKQNVLKGSFNREVYCPTAVKKDVMRAD